MQDPEKNLPRKGLPVKPLKLASRYGMPVLAAQALVAVVATCFGAFNVARAIVATMLPVAALVGVYIAVMEEDKE